MASWRLFIRELGNRCHVGCFIIELGQILAIHVMDPGSPWGRGAWLRMENHPHILPKNARNRVQLKENLMPRVFYLKFRVKFIPTCVPRRECSPSWNPWSTSWLGSKCMIFPSGIISLVQNSNLICANFPSNIQEIDKTLVVPAEVIDFFIKTPFLNPGTWIEFSLNSFHWIQQIQWIMAKSKTVLVTRCGTYLATDTLPVRVTLRIFLLLPLVTYLLPPTTLNRCQTRDSNGNLFFTTTWRNISVVKYGLSLVTTLLLI